MRFVVLLVAGLAMGCDVDPFCLNCGDGGAASDGSVGTGDSMMVERDTGPRPCVPADEELCNEEDDDCDGTVDEGFDLDADPNNCGSCGNGCAEPNSDIVCMEGSCTFRGCLDGFVDLDEDEPGCEYRCPIVPTTDEDCNGLDDDCDGVIDEETVPPANFCRTTPGTPCEGARPTCREQAGVTSWFCSYGDEVEFDPDSPNGIVLEESLCDGFDGDCDGLADDPFATLGDPCDNGELGACRDDGMIVCDPMDPGATVCDLSVAPDPVPGAPSAELCNGVDDNCDGIVDNSSSMDPDRIVNDMVHIDHGSFDFWIYRYEASRPDASDADPGELTTRACSNADSLPWTNVGYSAAEAACTAAGHRLCSAAEWAAACAGSSANAYPYGNAYQPDQCNGADRDAVAGGGVDHIMAPAGALAMCMSEDMVSDLSGNAKEWTAEQQGMVGGRRIFVLRGGSIESPELGLTCSTDLSRATEDTVLPTIGFRCCADTGP